MKTISDYMKFFGDKEWVELKQIRDLTFSKDDPNSFVFFSEKGIQITSSMNTYGNKKILKVSLSPLFSIRKDLSCSEFEKYILQSSSAILKLFFGDIKFCDPISSKYNYASKLYEAIV